MKNVFIRKMVFLFTVFALNLSCSNTDETVGETKQVDVGIRNRSAKAAPNSVEISDRLYVLGQNDTIKELINNKFKFNYILKSENIQTKYINSAINDNFEVRNLTTNEYFRVVNIKWHTDYFTFDVETSDGDIVKDFTYYTDNSSVNFDINALPVGPLVRGIVALTVAIIASLEDSPLEQCREAMEALNCRGNKSPYMEFEEGWFSTSCNVGCR